MSRRIDIELTSVRGDGSWTWRAAGAKQPKGEVESSMLPAGAKVGDVLRVETETYIDGITITSVLPPKDARPEPERLEVVGSRRGDESFVTTALVERRGRGDRGRGREGREGGDRRERGRGDRGPRGDETRTRRPRPERAQGERGSREGREGRPSRPRSEGAVRERAPRRERPAAAAPAPKAARLRPGRAHRNAVLAELPDEQKPIAEQILRGGIPAVRQAVEKQNEAARAEGLPEVKADALLALAEQLLPRLRAAEWRDKAEAALVGVNEIDLRDLRTVVVAADAAARDEETRALAQQLRDALTARVEGEHTTWLRELAELIGDNRVVRALRLSSRPPKAGAPLPADLAERLAAAAGEGLTAEITQDRWATLVDAVAFSPVRLNVSPAGVPASPSDELKATIARVGARVPQIAALFGITPEASPPRRPGPGAGGRGRRTSASARPGARAGAATAAAEAAGVQAPGAERDESPAAEAAPAASVGDAEVAEAAEAAEHDAPERVDAPTEAAGPEGTAAVRAPSGEAGVSGDGAQDAVLVEELGESVDE